MNALTMNATRGSHVIALIRRLCASLASTFADRRRKFLGLKTATGAWGARYRDDRHHDAIRLADSAHQYFDEKSAALGNATTIQGQRRKIACKAGCFHCCNLYVSATSSELLLIEGFISGLPTQTAEAIKGRVQDAYTKAKGKSMAERDRVRIRCPLLSQHGTCDAYPVRPLTCRSYVSFDLPACKVDAENPGEGTQVNRSGSLVQIRSGLFEQLVAKERQRGYAAGSYELIQGLHALLKAGGVVEGICRGVDPLVNARSR